MPRINDPRQWFTDEQERELVALEGNGVILKAFYADIEPMRVVETDAQFFVRPHGRMDIINQDALPELPSDSKRQDHRIRAWAKAAGLRRQDQLELGVA